MTDDRYLMETLPWGFTGAVKAIDGSPYAIGAIYSKKLGGVIVSIGYDGPDMDVNIARVNIAASFILERIND
jgi:hypothetical protein